MSDEPPAGLEGWEPPAVQGEALADVVERAFDYRGDVTLVLADGRRVEGYLFNRDRDVAEPFVQVFERGGGALTVAYAQIRAVQFTGRDTAAGNSYAAWLRVRQAVRADAGG